MANAGNASGQSLNQVLRDLGFRTRKTGSGFPAGTKHICRAGTGNPIFTGNAGEVWDWLRRMGWYDGDAGAA